MRRHHEELTAVLPSLWLLIPFAGALWARIKTVQRTTRPEGEGDV